MMPRLLALWAMTGCRFDADYQGGTFRCSDGVCPEGLTCVAEVCVDPSRPDAAPFDAPPSARTCADPEPLAGGAPVTVAGDTTGGTNHVSAMCGGGILNAPDEVFHLLAEPGDDLDVSIAGDAIIEAYVVSSCVAPPSTPPCSGGATATVGNPIALTGLPAGDVFVVVDGDSAALGGSYELTVHLR